MPTSFEHDWRQEFKRLEGAYALSTLKSYMADVKFLRNGVKQAALTHFLPMSKPCAGF